MIRSISQRLATQLLEAGAQHMPNQSIVSAIIRLAWASTAGNLGLMNGSPEELHLPFKDGKFHKQPPPKEDDIALATEAVEVLALAIALHPQCLDSLCKDTSWHQFIIDLVLMSNVREIRLTGADQFQLIGKCQCEIIKMSGFNFFLFSYPMFRRTATNPVFHHTFIHRLGDDGHRSGRAVLRVLFAPDEAAQLRLGLEHQPQYGGKSTKFRNQLVEENPGKCEKIRIFGLPRQPARRSFVHLSRPFGLYECRQKVRRGIQFQNGSESSQGFNRGFHFSGLENVCRIQEYQRDPHGSRRSCMQYWIDFDGGL